jgi:hypothetical protein
MDRQQISYLIVRAFGVYLLILALMLVPDLLVGLYASRAYSNLVSSMGSDNNNLASTARAATSMYRSLLFAPLLKFVLFSAAAIYLLRGGGFLVHLLARLPATPTPRGGDDDAQQMVVRDRPVVKRTNMMDVYFARSKFGQAVSILASHPGRIEERFRSAYDNAISCVSGTDIPSDLADRYESIMRALAWIREGSSPPSEDELQLLANRIEDMYALIDSSMSPSE